MSAVVKKTAAAIAVAAMLAVAGFITLNGLAASGSASGRVASLLHLNSETVAVDEQRQADAIEVQLAALKAPGFVAIYDDEEGPGKLLGVSRRLPKGVTRGVDIALGQPPVAGWYYAMIRRDDGDGTFDPEKDQPARDARGAIVMTRFLTSTAE